MKPITLFLLLLIPFSLYAQSDPQIRVDFEVRIPTRQGLKLAAAIYQPVTITEPMPALLAITPYGADQMHQEALWFAQHGYTVVIAECRGRGNSEGAFVPFEFDGKDGYDICKWISKKEWCNGNIGMFGGSYLGKVQWLTLREHPPALKTIIPIASGAPGIDFPMRNNIFLSFYAQWLTLTYGRTTNLKAYTDLDYWNRFYEQCFKHYTPFIEFPSAAGIDGTIWKKWMHHPDFDKYYTDILPNELEYKYSTTSALTITGYFDDNQRGSVYFHTMLQQYAPDSIKEGSYIIVGPWDHSGSRHPKKAFYNMTFDDAALLDIRQLELDWFDWKLKGKKAPHFLKDRVMYYAMNTERWFAANSLYETSDTIRTLYFRSKRGCMHTTDDPGVLASEAGAGSGSIKILYDPRDTTDTYLRLREGFIDYGWHPASDARMPEKAVFQTAPFKRDITVCGLVTVKAFLSMNVPDTDLEAILYEVLPDGTYIYLTSDIKRARYRNSLTSASPVPRNEVEEYTFDTFHATCRTIKEGSTLVLAFGALNSPYYQKNYNSGLEVHLETDKAARTANIKLGHGKAFPSALILPIKNTVTD